MAVAIVWGDQRMLLNPPVSGFQVKLEGVKSASGAWSGYVIVTAVPAIGPAALSFNASADAVAAPPTCARGGQTGAWRVALVATARVAVTVCGAGSARSAGGGRTIFAATVAVAPAATVRVRVSFGPAAGSGGLAAAAFTPAVRVGFVAAVARRLGVDELRIEIIQVLCQPYFQPTASSLKHCLAEILLRSTAIRGLFPL
jgi:hypothetical protein